ncbi:unnamed protein product [Lota lota]
MGLILWVWSDIMSDTDRACIRAPSTNHPQPIACVPPARHPTEQQQVVYGVWGTGWGSDSSSPPLKARRLTKVRLLWTSSNVHPGVRPAMEPILLLLFCVPVSMHIGGLLGILMTVKCCLRDGRRQPAEA